MKINKNEKEIQQIGTPISSPEKSENNNELMIVDYYNQISSSKHTQFQSPTPTFSQLQNQAEQEFNHEKLSDSSSNLLMNKREEKKNNDEKSTQEYFQTGSRNILQKSSSKYTKEEISGISGIQNQDKSYNNN